MNAQTFCAQFDTEVTLPPEVRSQLQLEREIFGYKVYRLLDRLVLEREGRLYIHARPGETDTAFYPALGETTDSLDDDLMRQFAELANALSPEQLDCDGEVPPREVKRRRARLQRQWRALERQAGRVVTEDEVWAWNNAHHRIQGEKP